MKFEHSSHICLQSDADGMLSICIDDYELFDFIDDYLTEECGVSYENTQEAKRDDGRTLYSIVLGNKYQFDQIRKYIAKINLEEIERVYNLNN